VLSAFVALLSGQVKVEKAGAVKRVVSRKVKKVEVEQVTTGVVVKEEDLVERLETIALSQGYSVHHH